MKSISTRILEFLRADDGPTSVEYAMMLALIIIGAIGAVLSTGDVQRLLFESIGQDMDDAMNP